MKTIYKSTLLIALGCFALAVNAQKDTTYNRQVMLERDYNPTLQDASKINVTPSVYEPVVIKRDAKYVDKSPQISLNSNLLGAAESGDINTGVDFDKKRGYLSIGAGTKSNLEGMAGVRILNSSADQLDLFANHSSTSGNVDYLDKGYWLKKAKAKYSDTKVDLKYAHTFQPSILSIDASYFNTSYNYYGNSFIAEDPNIDYPFDLDSRQNVDVISFGAGLRSSQSNTGLLNYMFSANYKNFKNKYGPTVDDKGIKGGQFDLAVDFNTAFGADNVIGIKGSLMNQSVSDPKFMTAEDAFHSYTNITGSPYMNFEGDSWNATLGVNVHALFDVKTKFAVSPNLAFAYNTDETSRLYANVGGGVNNNTILDILQENRYANMMGRIQYSKTYCDATIGFKSGVITGFEFDIFGGFKYTKDDHLYAMTSVVDIFSWGNLSAPIYADLSTGSVGGQVKTNLIPYTDLSAKLTGYFYGIKYTDAPVSTKEAWGLPTFTAELNADIKVIPELTFSVNYQYAGGRKALSYVDNGVTTSVNTTNMKDINELNVRAEYQITDWVAVHGKVNNLLFQKYEKHYGYAMQGFNFLAGLSFKL